MVITPSLASLEIATGISGIVVSGIVDREGLVVEKSSSSMSPDMVAIVGGKGAL
jgi:hypothetical protein